MKILPRSGAEWFGLLLLPFKVFVPMGYVMVVIQRHLLGHRMISGPASDFVSDGYLLTFFVLVVGGMIQYRIGARRAYLSTCGFIIGLFVCIVLLICLA